ncbi:MAG: prolipoprotein diacylglyceryl transferase [Bryobacterales bacterium]|nr:prolipoprotein diacylglyceryl transferase [Bryobacterales bacterium]
MRITVFGISAGGALLVWLVVVLWRARAAGLEPRRALRLLESAIACGVLGAAIGGFTGRPGWAGFSSLGAAFGAVLGAALSLRPAPQTDRWRYLDIVIYAFPFGWALVRLGCTLQREHPGRITSSFLGVAYPDGQRYDLALLEMLLAITLTALFLVLGRRPRPPGYFVRFAALCGPLRLLIESLREPPAAPNVIAALMLTAAGLWVWRRAVD